MTIPFAFAMMFSICLAKYLGDGPIFPKDGIELPGCAANWWKHLFYIHNFENTFDNVITFISSHSINHFCQVFSILNVVYYSV